MKAHYCKDSSDPKDEVLCSVKFDCSNYALQTSVHGAAAIYELNMSLYLVTFWMQEFKGRPLPTTATQAIMCGSVNRMYNKHVN